MTFKSTAFNVTELKAYFINPCCFGDDLARWLIQELRNRGLDTDDEPGQEDFGWYLNFKVLGRPYTFVVGHRPGGQEKGPVWIGWLERNSRFFGSLLGSRKRGINPLAAKTLHSVLSESAQIQDVRWYFQDDFDQGQEQVGAATP